MDVEYKIRLDLIVLTNNMSEIVSRKHVDGFISKGHWQSPLYLSFIRQGDCPAFEIGIEKGQRNHSQGHTGHLLNFFQNVLSCTALSWKVCNHATIAERLNVIRWVGSDTTVFLDPLNVIKATEYNVAINVIFHVACNDHVKERNDGIVLLVLKTSERKQTKRRKIRE
jgi:hypothetical protein